MLGSQKTRSRDRLVPLALEDVVPAGHCYRHRDASLGLSFVREWVKGRYAERGRPWPGGVVGVCR